MRRAALTISLLAALALSGAALAVDYFAVSGTAKDTAGNALVSPSIKVYVASNGNSATIYSDSDGSSQANPFTAGSDGTYSFWVTAGTYRVVATKSGVDYTTIVKRPAGKIPVTDLYGTCTPASGTEVVTWDSSGVAQCTTTPSGGGGGGDTNSFETFNAPNGTDPVADSSTDTLNITCSGGLTCTGTAATDTLALVVGNITGSAATLTTPRAIYGNNFDGSAALTQVIASTYGGTGNGFTKFTGPTTTEKTFTLPNASSVILTDNAAVTVAQGGTGASTLTSHGVLLGHGTSAVTATAAGTSGLPLLSGGAGADPDYGTLASSGITDGTIVNADINASAAIALSKLATATASKCARFDSGGVLVPASGDCASGDTTGSGLSNPLSAGSVSTTALQVVDTNTGLYQSATHTLDAAANGLRMLTLNPASSGVSFLKFTNAASDGTAWLTLESTEGGFQHQELGIASLGQRSLKFKTDGTVRFQIAGNTGSFDAAAFADGNVSMNPAPGTGHAAYAFIAASTTGLGEAARDKPAMYVSDVEVGRWNAYGIRLIDTGSRPTCDSTIKGTIFYDAGGAGVADTVAVCAKDAGDAYAWHDLF